MAGVHRLQHVEAFFAAYFAQHDAIWPHAQRVDDQLALAYHAAMSFDVRWPRFQPHNVLLLHLQFGRVFDGDDAFAFRNKAGKNVEQRGLARACAAGHDDVEARLDSGAAQCFQHGRG